MNFISKINNKVLWLAAICLFCGFSLMALGNKYSGNPFDFMTLTLSPCLLLLGYSLIAVGIMKK